VDVVIEEGLANAYRHGDATRVDMNIWADGNDIVVEIIDDGRGLGDVTSGMGSQRMAAVGALSLMAHAGGGTALTVAVSR
jgi:signal transduction histidine kinase